MRRALTFSLMFYLAISLYGQTELHYGDNHMARLAKLGEIDHYQFKADSGDIIWIRMRDITKVDAYFKLYNPTGGLVAQDSDDGGLAFIKDVKLHQTGFYQIEAFDWHHNDIGDYGISLHQLNGPDYAESLPCAVNFTDEIASCSAIKVFSFVGIEGDLLHTQMRGLTEHIEPEYFLYNSDGNLVFKSQRHGRMAKCTMSIPSSATYFLYVMDKGGNDMDEYGFSLQYLNRHDCTHVLSCGTTEEGELAHMAARNPYILEMSTGEMGLLQMRSSDPSVELSFAVYDVEGKKIVEKTGSDKMIDASLVATENTTYMVVTYDKHGNDLGPYGIHYESITHNPCSQEILCDASNNFKHELSAMAQLRSYYINGYEGDTYSFLLQEVDSQLEPLLRMYDEFGNLIIYESASKKVAVNGVFTHTGAYYILVGDRSGNDIGAYTFASTASESLMVLPDTITISKENPCATIQPKIVGLVNTYSWSNGASSPSVETCAEEGGELSLTVTFANGCQANASTTIMVEKSPCETMSFDEFITGQIPGDLGFVEISAVSNHNRGTNLVTVFNSTDPPKHSEGLGTPHKDFGGAGVGGGGASDHRGENKYHQNQVLVIAENDIDNNGDGVLDQPVDDPNGGYFLFEYQELVDISSILIIDQHHKGGSVETFDINGNLIDRKEFETLGNNSVETVQVNAQGVETMKVEFIKWGAIDDVRYCINNHTHIAADVAPVQTNSEKVQIDHREEVELQGEMPDALAINLNRVNPEFQSIIYPNPTADFLKIRLSDKHDGNLSITISDVSGKMIHRQQIKEIYDGPRSIDLTMASTGIYFLELRSDSVREIHKVQIVK